MAGNVLRIGNVEVTSVLDASASAPLNLLFPALSRDDWRPFDEHLVADGEQMPLSITSFIVRSGGRTVLVDSGIGNKDRPLFPNGRLPDALAEAGVRADEIDIVLATHIHIDHVGWHTTASDGGYVPTFPRAKHIFSRAEWEFWTAPAVANARGNEHVIDSVLPLEGKVDIELVDGEHAVTDEIRLLPTPGHTPAHVSVAIASAGEAGVILGDVCHHPAQVTETGWSPVFDANPTLAASSRETLMRRIEEERLIVAAGHFAQPGFGRVVRVDGKRYWRGLA